MMVPYIFPLQSESRLCAAVSTIGSMSRDERPDAILSICLDGVPLMTETGLEASAYSLTEPTRLPLARFDDFLFS